jgi:hypothetical protein
MKMTPAQREARNAYMREYLRKRRAATAAAFRAPVVPTRSRAIDGELRAWCEARGYMVAPGSRFVTVATQGRVR